MFKVIQENLDGEKKQVGLYKEEWEARAEAWNVVKQDEVKSVFIFQGPNQIMAITRWG